MGCGKAKGQSRRTSWEALLITQAGDDSGQGQEVAEGVALGREKVLGLHNWLVALDLTKMKRLSEGQVG